MAPLSSARDTQHTRERPTITARPHEAEDEMRPSHRLISSPLGQLPGTGSHSVLSTPHPRPAQAEPREDKCRGCLPTSEVPTSLPWPRSSHSVQARLVLHAAHHTPTHAQAMHGLRRVRPLHLALGLVALVVLVSTFVVHPNLPRGYLAYSTRPLWDKSEAPTDVIPHFWADDIPPTDLCKVHGWPPRSHPPQVWDAVSLCPPWSLAGNHASSSPLSVCRPSHPFTPARRPSSRPNSTSSSSACTNCRPSSRASSSSSQTAPSRASPSPASSRRPSTRTRASSPSSPRSPTSLSRARPSPGASPPLSKRSPSAAP